MKVYVVIEEFDSGPGVASYNLCDIFLSEERANEMRDELSKKEKATYSEDEISFGLYYDSYRVLQWEVKE